ncbi:MAG TPA: DUF3568 family protein [Burkholderiales bacterium]|jgi:hypothetical protein
MRVLLAALGAAVLLNGCQSIAVSMAGAGATAALGATLAGISYRTFTAPLPSVRRASLEALDNMGMKPDSVGAFDAGEIIVARTAGVTVEIELEALTERATRMRVATRDGSLFYDAATASEIVSQTQKVLEARAASAPVSNAKRVSTAD